MSTGLVIDRMPPNAIDAEEAVLGSVLLDPEAINRVMTIVDETDFYIVKHQWVYRAVLNLRSRKEPIDFVTVCAELSKSGRLDEIGGPAFISRLINSVPTAIHASGYAEIVRESAINRSLLVHASEAAQLAYATDEPVENKIAQLASGLSKLRRQSALSESSLDEALDKFQDKVDEWAENPIVYGQVRDIPTGLKDLDGMTGGLDRGTFCIIGGRPGMGKSVLSDQIALYAALQLKRVLIFSLEMTTFQITARLVCSQVGVPWRKIKEGQLTSDEYADIIRVAGNTMRGYPLTINDATNITTAHIAARAAQLKPDLIVVDHFHLLKDPAGRESNQVQRLGDMAMRLKDIAKDNDCCVLSVMQLSRALETRQDKRPMLSDLRESGRIEEAADLVMMLYRDDYYDPETLMKGISELIVRKFRDGDGNATAELYFDRKFSRFRDVDLRPIGAQA